MKGIWYFFKSFKKYFNISIHNGLQYNGAVKVTNVSAGSSLLNEITGTSTDQRDTLRNRPDTKVKHLICSYIYRAQE